MWQRLDIPMVPTVYKSPYNTPAATSYRRCDVKYSLHYNNVDRLPVDSTKYLIAADGSQLSI